MSVSTLLRRQASLLWRFLGFFQKPSLRMIHALVVGFVILQLLSSTLMHVSPAGHVSDVPLPWLASWYHLLAGLVTVVLACLLTESSLTQWGFRHFFPYLWGDTAQLKQDILASLHLKMFPPRPKGLAATVQGLGLGALALVALSGLIWFLLWLWASPTAAATAREVHKSLSGLVELYLLGHGGMALLHFVMWQRKTKP